jgi:hypothetical protein
MNNYFLFLVSLVFLLVIGEILEREQKNEAQEQCISSCTRGTAVYNANAGTCVCNRQ